VYPQLNIFFHQGVTFCSVDHVRPVPTVKATHCNIDHVPPVGYVPPKPATVSPPVINAAPATSAGALHSAPWMESISSTALSLMSKANAAAHPGEPVNHNRLPPSRRITHPGSATVDHLPSSQPVTHSGVPTAKHLLSSRVTHPGAPIANHLPSSQPVTPPGAPTANHLLSSRVTHPGAATANHLLSSRVTHPGAATANHLFSSRVTYPGAPTANHLLSSRVTRPAAAGPERCRCRSCTYANSKPTNIAEFTVVS